jgi:hypothetical protein
MLKFVIVVMAKALLFSLATALAAPGNVQNRSRFRLTRSTRSPFAVTSFEDFAIRAGRYFRNLPYRRCHSNRPLSRPTSIDGKHLNIWSLRRSIRQTVALGLEVGGF